MKVVFFGNGALGCNILNYLIDCGEEVCAVVVHPAEKAKELPALLELAERANACVIDATSLRTDAGLDAIRLHQAEMGLSVMFGYILRPELLECFPRGCINLHPAYLPYNRGAHPNVWPIVDGTPAGVTLHEIDSGVDTGPILAQEEVEVAPEDTAETLYERLMSASFQLFEKNWQLLKSGSLKAMAQEGEGTIHKVAELSTLDLIDLDAPTTARQVLNQLRARTFPPYPGAYFVAEDGRKIFVRLELSPEK